MERDRGNGQREGFGGRWELNSRALVDMSRELASDMIRHIRHAGKGIWGQRGTGGEGEFSYDFNEWKS